MQIVGDNTVTQDPIDDPVQQSGQVIKDLEGSIVASRDLTFHWEHPTRGPVNATFTQEALGFGGVQKLNQLMAETVRGFTEGEHGLKLGDLFAQGAQDNLSIPTSFTDEEVNKVVDENQTLIAGFIHLVQILPDFQKDLIALSLGVPEPQLKWFQSQIFLPPSQGGLTIDEGFDILTVFLDQNIREVKRFFGEKGRQLVSKIQAEVLGDGQPQEQEAEATPTEMANLTPALLPTEEPSSPGGTPSSTSSTDIQANV